MRITSLFPAGRGIGLALVLSIFAAFGLHVFTATNTVPASQAGAGSAAISGYTVTNVQYTLNTANPQNMDGVSFTISPVAATTVKAQLAAAGLWYTCANAAGSVTCATTSPQATVLAATQLTVVATS
jgi:hypothetical protein